MPTETKHETLAQFASTGEEPAFAAVVEEFGGLVFNGALRRTGDRQMAEEVSQNVFAIAARKARKLSRHPLLKAWFHTTTRLEASKAMQSRRRYRRRIETLAEEMKLDAQSLTVEERENWREALPLLDESLDRLPPVDREILLGRFFEERSFREIAASSGASEAACKMRLKRALSKLNGWLTRRGVTLSATALATCLTAELSKAAPVAVSASLPANAITASSGVTVTTILTNTLNTMSTAKSAGVAAAIVIALGSIPVAIQHGQANQLRAEFETLEEQITSRASTRAEPGGTVATPTVGKIDSTPVRAFLKGLERPRSADELITQLTNAMMSRDQGAMVRVMIPLSELSPDESRNLLDGVKASEKGEEMKAIALQMLSMVGSHSEESLAESLDRQLKDGVLPLNIAASVRQWAKDDPDAAIAWFNERRGSVEFLGTAVNDSPQQQLFAGLVAGLAKVDPQRARALLAETDIEGREIATRELIVSLATEDAQGRTTALEVARGIESQNERAIAVQSVTSSLAFRGQMDEAIEFARGAELDDRGLAQAIAAAASTGGQNPARSIAELTTWALENVPENAQSQLASELVWRNHHSVTERELTTWIDSLPQGEVRDAGLEAQSQVFTRADRIEDALARAGEISDPATQRDSINRAFVWLNSRNPAAAAQMAQKHGYDLDEVLGN